MLIFLRGASGSLGGKDRARLVLACILPLITALELVAFWTAGNKPLRIFLIILQLVK
jgi:hypothetical protein